MSIADPFSTYVPTGSKAYNEQFDPAINKDLPTSVMGQAASRTGLGISSLADSIRDYFSPNIPSPTPSQYETRADIIGRTSQNPLNSWSAGREAAKKQALADAVSSVMSQAQTSPSIANMSLEDKKTAINELAEENYQSYSDAMPDIAPVSRASIGDMSFWGPSAAEVEARQRQKELFNAPTPLEERKMRAQEIQNQLKELIGEPTAGIPGATQLAGGPNLYQGKYQGETGMFSPGGRGQQFYGGQQQEGFFDKFGTGVGEAMDNAYGYLSRLVT